MNNRSIMKDAVMTGAFSGEGKGGRLNPEQSKRFTSYMVDNTAFLKDIRLETMAAPEKQLYTLNIGGRLIRKAAEGAAPDELAGVATSVKELRSTKVRIAADITAEVAEDTIEGAGTRDRIARELAMQFGNDLADLALNGDTADNGDDKKFLTIGDGFIKQAKASGAATHKVDIGTSAADRKYKDTIFPAMLTALPNMFKRDRGNLRFYVSPAVADAYISELALRNTQLGDSILVDGTLVKFRGIQIFPVEYMPDDVLLLTPRLNLATGVQREFVVHGQFNPRKDLTEYTMYARVDPGKIIWDDALVIAYNKSA